MNTDFSVVFKHHPTPNCLYTINDNIRYRIFSLDEPGFQIFQPGSVNLRESDIEQFVRQCLIPHSNHCSFGIWKCKIFLGMISNDTLSAFARNAMLSACGGRLEISVNTNDLEELNDLVAQVNMHVQGFLGALRFRSEVQKADIEYIDKQLDTINDGVQKLNRKILKNRYSIRQQGRRSVEKQVCQLLSYTQKRGGDNRDSD